MLLFIQVLNQTELLVGNPNIKMTTSIIDYIFRELAVTYLARTDLAHIDPSEVNISPIDSITQKEEEIEFNEEEIYSERIIEEIISKPSKVKPANTSFKASIKLTSTPVRLQKKIE